MIFSDPGWFYEIFGQGRRMRYLGMKVIRFAGDEPVVGRRAEVRRKRIHVASSK